MTLNTISLTFYTCNVSTSSWFLVLISLFKSVFSCSFNDMTVDPLCFVAQRVIPPGFPELDVTFLNLILQPSVVTLSDFITQNWSPPASRFSEGLGDLEQLGFTIEIKEGEGGWLEQPIWYSWNYFLSSPLTCLGTSTCPKKKKTNIAFQIVLWWQIFDSSTEPTNLTNVLNWQSMKNTEINNWYLIKDYRQWRL